MREFLIRPNDVEWFDLKKTQFAEAFTPNSVLAKQIDGRGDYCIAIGDVEVYFSDEDPGIYVCFEGEIEETLADRIIEEVLANIMRITGQQGRIVRL